MSGGAAGMVSSHVHGHGLGHGFRPGTIKAKAGGTVTWINKDIVAHTAAVLGGFDVNIEANAPASVVQKSPASLSIVAASTPP